MGRCAIRFRERPRLPSEAAAGETCDDPRPNARLRPTNRSITIMMHTCYHSQRHGSGQYKCKPSHLSVGGRAKIFKPARNTAAQTLHRGTIRVCNNFRNIFKWSGYERVAQRGLNSRASCSGTCSGQLKWCRAGQASMCGLGHSPCPRCHEIILTPMCLKSNPTRPQCFVMII